MALISTRTHAVGDYAGGALMLAAAKLPFVRDRRAAALLRAAGAGTLVAGALTDNELGVWRKLPMRTHLTLDAVAGALMTGSAALLRRAGAGAGSWVPHVAIGVGQLAGASLTERTPSGRGSDGIPAAPAHLSGEGLAAREPAEGGAPIASPPVETPGPSVTAPGQPESDVERAERVDAALTEVDAAPTGDALVAQQEAAAAAEAAAIGEVSRPTRRPGAGPGL